MKTNYLFKARWLQGAASANESKKMQGNPRKSLLKEGLSKDESSTRLRVDYVSFTSRLRVWHVLCSRMAAVFLMLLTLSVGNAWADYTIVFKDGSGTSTIDASTLSNFINSGASYVTSASSSYMYPSATTGYGIRLASSNNAGNLTLNLSATGQIKASKITFNAAYYGTDASTMPYTITYTDNTTTTGTISTLSTSLADKEVSLTSTKTIKTIYIGTTAKKKRVYVHSIAVTAAAAATPTVTPDPTSLSWGTVLQGSSQSTKTISITGTNLTAGTLTISATGGYSVTPTSKSVSGTLSATTLTVTPPSTATTGAKNGKVTISGGGLASDVEVNLSMTVNAASTVTWMNNGSEYTTTLVENGSKPTFPSNPSSCDGTSTTFYGWSTSEWSGKIDDISAKTIYTSAASMPTVSGAVTYYAVFAKAAGGGSTTLLSEDFSSITTGNSTSTSGSSTSWTINSNFSSASYQYQAGGAVRLGSGTYAGYLVTKQLTAAIGDEITIAFKVKGWSSVEGNIQVSGNNSEFTQPSATTYTATMSGSFESKSVTVTLTKANPYIKIATTAKRAFIDDIVITKSGSLTYSQYLTTCCTALGTINGSVSWSSVSSSSSTATLSWANNSNVNSYSVTCKASGASAGSVESITGTTTKSCAITGLTPGTEYTFTINATGKSGYCDASQEIVAKAPKITAGSASGTSTYIAGSGPGSIQTFTVSGAGLTGNLTVTAPTNFLVSTDNGSSWSTSGGSKTITVSTPPSDLASTTVKFRLAADLSENSYGPSDITISGGNAASVTVAVSGTVSPACSAPTITAHPTGGVTYRVNVTATALSVTATKNGTGPDLTYQWYSNTSNNNTTGTIIAGATSRTYTPPTSTPGTKYYYCEVSSGACMTPSNCAAITVSTPTITVSETSRAFGNKAKDSSSTMTFTVSGSNLGANIGLAISGTNAAMFSIDKTSLTHSSGTVSTQTITVTYNPTAVGSHTAQINITSTGATTKTVSLSGTGAWTVDWYVGGTDSENKLTSGSQSTLATNGSNVSDLTYPTSSQTTIDCGDKTFVGWTNTSSYTHGTSPLFTKATATGTITGNVAYYAVFAEASVNSEELTESEIKSQFTTASHKYDDSDVSYTDGDVTWNAKYNVDAADRPWIQFNSTAYMQITAPGKITKVELIVTSTSNKSGGIADKTQYNAFGSAVTLSLLTATSAGTNVGSSTTNTEDSYQEITINVSSGDNTSLYLMSSAAYRIWGITVTYGGYSDHSLTCTTCNKVTVSYSDPSHATLSVKKSAAVISSGTQVSTCSSQTLTVKVTPDAANHYWMTAMSISGVTDISTDPSTTSGLPTKEQKSYSVTIPKDATGTLTITPTIEAIPQKTISFLVNGDDAADNSPQDVYMGEKPELPTVPDDEELSCAEAFVGWSTNELTETGNAKPADLFFTSTQTPTVTDDVTYHAVFASKDGSKSGKYTLDWSVETSLQSKSLGYGSATSYTATDGSSWTVKAYKNSGMQINTGQSSSIKIPDCPSGATITTIEITGSTSKAVGISASDYSGSGTITYIATGTDATSQTLDLRGLEVTGGYIVPKSGSIAITKIVVNYAKYKDYMTYCTKIFTDAAGADHNWSTAGNWTGGVPTIKERARIEKPVTVDVTTAKAKNVMLMQNSTNTGQLVIDAGKELVVAETVRKTIDGSNYTATGENDIVINSTSGAGLGALVMGTHDGTNKATVNFATLSNGAKDNSGSDAQYIGTPFSNSPKMLYQFYNSWMYKFVNTGVPGWTRVDGEDGLTAFKGYCIFSADGTNHTYWMQGTLVASETQVIEDLYYSGSGDASDPNHENMLANSWMAPIKIAAFQASDFTNANATIYIYNTGSLDDYNTNGSGTGDLTGQYKTYTPGTAGTAIIPSMQAFSVYTSGSSPKITLDYSKLVYNPAEAGSVAPGPNKAPKRAGASEDEADKMRLFVRAENGYGDMLYMWEREDFEEGFENGWDGRKMFGADVAPQLYAVTTDGNMAINCVPDWEGTVLGFKKGTEDNVYTFTFEYEGENTWYLNDMKEQTSTLISSESRYMFMASDEDMAARFIISRTPIHSTPTGIEQSAISGQKSAVKKIVIDDHVYIIRNGKMYSAEGVMVR